MTGRLVLAAALLGAAAATGALDAPSPAVAGAPPPPAIPPELVPPYRSAPFWPLGGTVHVGGRPRRLQYATPADGPTEVADVYEALWRSEGLTVTRRRLDSEDWVVAHDARVLRTIVAVPRGRGTLLVASARDRGDETVPDPVPRPAGCAPSGRGGSDDPGARRELAAFNCAGNADAALAFYRERFGPGLAVAADGSRGSVTRFAAGATEVVVTTRPLAGDPRRTLLVVDWQEPR
jgi:hypothetical protein